MSVLSEREAYLDIIERWHSRKMVELFYYYNGLIKHVLADKNRNKESDLNKKC